MLQITEKLPWLTLLSAPLALMTWFLDQHLDPSLDLHSTHTYVVLKYSTVTCPTGGLLDACQVG